MIKNYINGSNIRLNIQKFYWDENYKLLLYFIKLYKKIIKIWIILNKNSYPK